MSSAADSEGRMPRRPEAPAKAKAVTSSASGQSISRDASQNAIAKIAPTNMPFNHETAASGMMYKPTCQSHSPLIHVTCDEASVNGS